MEWKKITLWNVEKSYSISYHALGFSMIDLH